MQITGLVHKVGFNYLWELVRARDATTRTVTPQQIRPVLLEACWSR